MVRTVAALLVAGCSFTPGTVPGDEPDGGGGLSPTDDDASVVPRVCKYGHSSLRLCLEFDDGALDPIRDASSAAMNIDTTNLQKLAGPKSPAAATVLGSVVHVPETPNLDVATQATLEMWVGPVFDIDGRLIVNDQQYSMWIDASQHIGCRFGGATVVSDTVAPLGAWSHVACTFDAGIVNVYVNNSVKCARGTNTSIAMNGTMGTWIAPQIAIGIDDIHIYATALSGAEICTHADVTCALACTPED